MIRADWRDDPRFVAELDRYAEQVAAAAPPLSDRQRVLLRANLTHAETYRSAA